MKDLFGRAAEGNNPSYRDLYSILDALPVALSWATLPGGHIRYVNRTFQRMFGYDERRFPTVDHWITEVYETPLEQRTARERWAALWQGEHTGVSEIEPLELRVRCADGTFKTTQHRGMLLWDIGIGVATFEDISERKLAEDVMRRVALEDPLTGLANRRALQDGWQSEVSSRSKAQPSRMAVLLVDLDGFKPINDQLGHEAGDAVLKMVADRLRLSVRPTDLVGRVGGDEFVVLLPYLKDTTEADAICRSVSEALSTPFHCEGSIVKIGASIGISLYPQDGQNLQTLMRHADQALYRRKRSGQGGWEWFAFPAA
ncbi:sensor domain-containing diguanylate cyclase [Neorhizobium galegae]|uniref:sensor domain-containing protein n=1 Tax=Neorhizobium galegae TaxID=399 RepID=UPI0021071EE5|nr:sensor domain-containing diguanylate cyclase [Neorhizobium galegae]MCQ1775614.1 sensor domain-containing diguanylate cyclase [Neorhizobium galegae]MCQ1798118.1 sensor domain-containing diguanylate cyclase [Neorhizobium galegae]